MSSGRHKTPVAVKSPPQESSTKAVQLEVAREVFDRDEVIVVQEEGLYTDLHLLTFFHRAEIGHILVARMHTAVGDACEKKIIGINTAAGAAQNYVHRRLELVTFFQVAR